MRLVLTLLTAISFALAFLPLTVAAHVEHLGVCKKLGITETTKVTHVGEDAYDRGTGLLLEMYDLDGDGQQDLGTLSQVGEVTKKNGKLYVAHRLAPTFYFVGPGPAYVYVDVVGEGKCKDIVLYENLLVPNDRFVEESPTITNHGREIKYPGPLTLDTRVF